MSREHEKPLQGCFHKETAALRTPNVLVHYPGERAHMQPFPDVFLTVLEGACSSKHLGRMHLSP